MNSYSTLEEEYIYHKKSYYNFNKNLTFGNDSPYEFQNFFYSSMSYSDFTRKISNIISQNISNDEIIFLKKYYGKKKINKTHKLSKIIRKNKYIDLIKSFIVTKRIEFLHEYIIDYNFNKLYINYVNKILEIFYNDTRILINNLIIYNIN